MRIMLKDADWLIVHDLPSSVSLVPVSSDLITCSNPLRSYEGVAEY